MATLKRTRCTVCHDSSFTYDNYTERRKLTTRTGAAVHLGCLGRWLVNDAIRRNFPDSDARERDVVRIRLGLPDEPSLVPLRTVGRMKKWTGSMRASQVQSSAFEGFERAAKARIEARAAASQRSIELQEALERVERAGEELNEATEALVSASR